MSELGTAPIFNPATGLYYADLTVTNISTAAITGPLYVMLQGLPTGVTLTSFTQTDSRGDPWKKFDQSTLAPGTSLADIQLVFADPTGVPISYTTKVFDGMAADPALSFEPNVGQADSSVSFIARGPGFELGLAGDHAALMLAGGAQNAGAAALMSWVGGNPSPQAIPLDLQTGLSNYLLGNQSIDGVAHYGRVMFANVYDGVDLTYYGHAGQLEFDWTVNPGADAGAIAMRFDGVQSMRIDDAGNLHLATAAGDLIERAPVAYQMINGQREDVSASFVLRADGTVGFVVGAHDTSAALVIDPVLEFATYLGGSDPFSSPFLEVPDNASAVAVDAQGNSYITGYTYSADFPTVNALQAQPTAAFTSDAFITKLAPDGTVLFSTYFGGGLDASAFPFGPTNFGNGTQARAIAVDTAGDIFVAGFTDAQSFPLLNPVAGAGAVGFRGFLTELGPDGASLKFSTDLPPSLSDIAAIAVDASGDVYATGGGLSFGAGADVETFGFAFKIDPLAAAIDYSEFLLGAGTSIAVDDQGQAYIAGTAGHELETVNALLPTSDARQAAFVTKLAADGSTLFSTYLTTGPSFAVAYATGIALGPNGEIEVAGNTQSADLLLANGLQTARDDAKDFQDGFLIKLANDGSQALYGTYIGSNITVNGLAVDAQGRAYLAGSTVIGFEGVGPPVLPTVNAFQPSFIPDFFAPTSGFAGALAADGSRLDYLTWGIGDNAKAVAVDPAGDATFVSEQGGAAQLTSPGEFDIPTTPGAFQPLPAGGGSNIFVVRILSGDAGTVTLHNVPVQAVEGQPFTDTVVAAFTTTGSETASQFTATIEWGDGTSSAGTIVGDFSGGFRVLGSHLYDTPGTWGLGVTLYDPQGRPIGVSSSDATAAASGHVHYHVSLDTSAFAGTDGRLAIQFNPGAIPGAPDAQALISHLVVTGGTLAGLALDGGASGAPTTQATLTPSTVLNRLLQNVTFGSRVDFDVDLVGPGISAPAHGSFTDALAVQVLAADGKTRSRFRCVGQCVAHRAQSGRHHAGSRRLVVCRCGRRRERHGRRGRPQGGVHAVPGPGGPALQRPGGVRDQQQSARNRGRDARRDRLGRRLGADRGHHHGRKRAVRRQRHPYLHQRRALFAADRRHRARRCHRACEHAVRGYRGGAGDRRGRPGQRGFQRRRSYRSRHARAERPPAAAIELAQADGSFGAPIALPPGGLSNSPVLAADFNGDGKLDLAVLKFDTNVSSYELQVLIGHGDGTFQAGPVSALLGPAVSIAAGDFNGDHHVDLVLELNTGFNRYGFTVMLGNGDGSFAAPVNHALNGFTPAITVADLNQDGRDDLVVSSNASVYFAAADGSFGAATAVPGLGGITVYGAADFTGDGKLDLVGLSGDGSHVEIFAGNGDGTFAAPVSQPLPFTATSLAVGDMNNDRRPGIIVATQTGNSQSTLGNLAILLGGPTGQLQLSYELDHFSQASIPVLADFNGDGNLDVLSPSGAAPHLFYGRGDGTLIAPSTVVASAGSLQSAPSAVVSFDVNGDGIADLVTSVLNGVAVQLGHGDGTFDQQVQVPVAGDASFVAAAKLAGYAVGDINGDGRLDLVKPTSANGTTVLVLRNNGDGSFFSTFVQVGPSPVSAALADLNGDGKLDLIAAVGGSSAQNYADAGLVVALGNGDGTFGHAVRYPAGAPTLTSFSGKGNIIAVGDLGNGKQDIVVASSGQVIIDSSGRQVVTGRGVFVLLGNGDGTFRAGPTYLDDPQLTSVSVGGFGSVALSDFNGDHRLDLVVSLDQENFGNPNVNDDVLLMLGNGDGTFGPAKPIDATKYDAAQLAVGDLNGDGKLDLVVMDHSGQTTGSPVNVVLGNGDGTFQSPQTYAVGDQIQSSTPTFVPQGVVLADLDGDGKLDVAVGESGNGTVGSTLTVLLGHGDGTLVAPRLSTQATPEVPLLSGGDEVTVATADLRGVGRTDLIGGGIDGITVHLRNSDGSYATPVTYGLNGRVSQIATGDLTGDGRPDIVALLPDQNAVAVLINNGDGTFTRGANLSPGHGVGSLLLGDFSGDGKLDLAVTVNGDPDPATGLYPNAGVALALGNGNGTFAAPQLTLAGASPSGTVGHALAAGDLNHDGKLDLVVIATGLASPDFRQGGVFVLLGNGNGTFQAGPTYLTVNDYDQTISNAVHYIAPQSVALGDIDGDGTLDMAVSIGPSIFVLAGNGDGTFRHSHPKQHDTLNFAPFSTTGSWDLSVADLNADGRADIVATNRGGFLASSASLATMVATRDPFNEHSGFGWDASSLRRAFSGWAAPRMRPSPTSIATAFRTSRSRKTPRACSASSPELVTAR